MISTEELTRAILENKTNLYGLAYSITRNPYDAEDALSDAVLTSYRHRESIKNPESIRAWLYKVVHNEACALLRNKKNEDYYADISECGVPMEDAGMNPENINLWNQVLSLPEEYRSIVYLYYYKGLPLKQIQKIIGIPEGTIKSRLSKARSILYEKLREEE